MFTKEQLKQMEDGTQLFIVTSDFPEGTYATKIIGGNRKYSPQESFCFKVTGCYNWECMYNEYGSSWSAHIDKTHSLSGGPVIPKDYVMNQLVRLEDKVICGIKDTMPDISSPILKGLKDIIRDCMVDIRTYKLLEQE